MATGVGRGLVVEFDWHLSIARPLKPLLLAWISAIWVIAGRHLGNFQINGHISATDNPIHFMFGFVVGFSGMSYQMTLFPFRSNRRWRLGKLKWWSFTYSLLTYILSQNVCQIVNPLMLGGVCLGSWEKVISSPFLFKILFQFFSNNYITKVLSCLLH